MKRISLFTFFIFLGIAGCMAQASGEKIEKVYVAFKTHLDVGFTDLSSVVTERYVHDFIPKAIEVSERLRADGLVIGMYGQPAHGLFGNIFARHLLRL